MNLTQDIFCAREQRIIDIIYSGHHTLEEIAAKIPVYKKTNPKPVYFVYEQVMIMIHLQHLAGQGEVIKEDNLLFEAGQRE